MPVTTWQAMNIRLSHVEINSSGSIRKLVESIINMTYDISGKIHQNFIVKCPVQVSEGIRATSQPAALGQCRYSPGAGQGKEAGSQKRFHVHPLLEVRTGPPVQHGNQSSEESLNAG